MNKNYVLIMLFSQNKDKLLLVKRNKPPYQKCWNGIGGKIIPGETVIAAAKRECFEETGIKLENPKLLVTYIYPASHTLSSNTHLNVLYDFAPEVDVPDNDEGHYEWKDVDFVMDINSPEIAGFSNLNQFVKEILDAEGVRKFYG